MSLVCMTFRIGRALYDVGQLLCIKLLLQLRVYCMDNGLDVVSDHKAVQLPQSPCTCEHLDGQYHGPKIPQDNLILSGALV